MQALLTSLMLMLPGICRSDRPHSDKHAYTWLHSISSLCPDHHSGPDDRAHHPHSTRDQTPVLDPVQEILDVFASSWQDFDTVCLATALHRLGKLELGRDYYEFLSRQPDFVRLLTMIGEGCGTPSDSEDMSSWARSYTAVARPRRQCSSVAADQVQHGCACPRC